MRTVRAQVAYDGSQFFGWQRQDGFASGQEALEEALQELLGTVVVVHGAGRTDKGVHALRQVAHFHVDTQIVDDRLRHALNAHLPDGIVVDRLETCRDEFHSRFHARAKRYMYLTLTSRFQSPIAREYANWVKTPLRLSRMREAAARLVGVHDFAAFGNSGSRRKTTVRHVHAIKLIARRGRVAIVVQGNGFLYNMVRTIAGTLLDVGRGKLSPDDVSGALETGDRLRAGPTAAARGLYLVRVLYDEPTFAGPDSGPSGVPGAFPGAGRR